MNSIETIICLMLLLMAVPDLCRKLGRPALANACFVGFGLALGPLLKTDVATMVREVMGPWRPLARRTKPAMARRAAAPPPTACLPRQPWPAG